MSLLNVISVIAVILHLWASHAHKIKSASNYRAFYLILGLWNENCLTNQKLLRYRILLDTSKSICDLFLSLSLSAFSHFWATPPKKSIRIRIKAKWQRNWWSTKPKRRTHKKIGLTCWMNFVSTGAARNNLSEKSIGCAANDVGEYVTLSRRFSSRFIFLMIRIDQRIVVYIIIFHRFEIFFTIFLSSFLLLLLSFSFNNHNLLVAVKTANDERVCMQLRKISVRFNSD